jgi:hypothetical protein
MLPGDEHKGKLVRMKESFKEAMRRNGSSEHIDEFGDCVGVILGPMEPGWPEVDVRWKPSNLKYGYDIENLEFVAGIV